MIKRTKGFPGFYTLLILWHLSLTIGGVPVLVETHRAAEARAFIDALDTGGISLLDPTQTKPADHAALPPSKRGLLRRLWDLYEGRIFLESQADLDCYQCPGA